MWTRQWEREERSFSLCPTAVRVTSTSKANAATSSTVARGRIASPTVANDEANACFCWLDCCELPPPRGDEAIPANAALPFGACS